MHLATVTVNIITSNSTTIELTSVHQAVHHCLSLAHQLRELGMDMALALRPLSDLDFAVMADDGAVVTMLGDLLYRSSVWEQQLILNLGE